MATGISMLMLRTTMESLNLFSGGVASWLCLTSVDSPPHSLKPGQLELTIQVLDDATETVAVGSNDDVLPGLDFRGDDFVPERQGAGDGVLQRLAGGELTWLQVLVAP